MYPTAAAVAGPNNNVHSYCAAGAVSSAEYADLHADVENTAAAVARKRYYVLEPLGLWVDDHHNKRGRLNGSNGSSGGVGDGGGSYTIPFEAAAAAITAAGRKPSPAPTAAAVTAAGRKPSPAPTAAAVTAAGPCQSFDSSSTTTSCAAGHGTTPNTMASICSQQQVALHPPLWSFSALHDYHHHHHPQPHPHRHHSSLQDDLVHDHGLPYDAMQQQPQQQQQQPQQPATAAAAVTAGALPGAILSVPAAAASSVSTSISASWPSMSQSVPVMKEALLAQTQPLPPQLPPPPPPQAPIRASRGDGVGGAAAAIDEPWLLMTPAAGPRQHMPLLPVSPAAPPYTRCVTTCMPIQVTPSAHHYAAGPATDRSSSESCGGVGDRPATAATVSHVSGCSSSSGVTPAHADGTRCCSDDARLARPYRGNCATTNITNKTTAAPSYNHFPGSVAYATPAAVQQDFITAANNINNNNSDGVAAAKAYGNAGTVLDKGWSAATVSTTWLTSSIITNTSSHQSATEKPPSSLTPWELQRLEWCNEHRSSENCERPVNQQSQVQLPRSPQPPSRPVTAVPVLALIPSPRLLPQSPQQQAQQLQQVPQVEELHDQRPEWLCWQAWQQQEPQPQQQQQEQQQQEQQHYRFLQSKHQHQQYQRHQHQTQMQPQVPPPEAMTNNCGRPCTPAGATAATTPSNGSHWPLPPLLLPGQEMDMMFQQQVILTPRPLQPPAVQQEPMHHLLPMQPPAVGTHTVQGPLQPPASVPPVGIQQQPLQYQSDERHHKQQQMHQKQMHQKQMHQQQMHQQQMHHQQMHQQQMHQQQMDLKQMDHQQMQQKHLGNPFHSERPQQMAVKHFLVHHQNQQDTSYPCPPPAVQQLTTNTNAAAILSQQSRQQVKPSEEKGCSSPCYDDHHHCHQRQLQQQQLQPQRSIAAPTCNGPTATPPTKHMWQDWALQSIAGADGENDDNCRHRGGSGGEKQRPADGCESMNDTASLMRFLLSSNGSRQDSLLLLPSTLSQLPSA